MYTNISFLFLLVPQGDIKITFLAGIYAKI